MQKWEYLFIEVGFGYLSSSDPTFQAGRTLAQVRFNEGKVFEPDETRRRQIYNTERYTLAMYLAELGAEGWELVTMSHTDETGFQEGYQRELVFKRPLA